VKIRQPLVIPSKDGIQEKNLIRLNEFEKRESFINGRNRQRKGEFLFERCVAQKSFSLPASVLNKSKACFRRLQNSPAAQTLVIATLSLRQDLYAKTLAMSA